MPHSLLLIFGTIVVASAPTEEPPSFPGTKSRWEGFVRHDFPVDGANVIVVEPKEPLPGRPWVWRDGFSRDFPNAFADIDLLKRGWYLAYIGGSDHFGSPRIMKHWEKFYDGWSTSTGSRQEPALIGLSRGALYCMAWAATHPDKTLLVYLDNGVCDFKSWPGGKPKGLGSGQGSPEDGSSCSRRMASKTTARPLLPAQSGGPTSPRSPRRRFRSCSSTETTTRWFRIGRTQRLSTTGTRPWVATSSGSSSPARTIIRTD